MTGKISQFYLKFGYLVILASPSIIGAILYAWFGILTEDQAMATSGLSVLLAAFFGARTEWISNKVLETAKEDSSFYDTLPEYEVMINKFWIWNIRKFSKRKT